MCWQQLFITNLDAWSQSCQILVRVKKKEENMGKVTFGWYRTFLKWVDALTNLHEAKLTRLFLLDTHVLCGNKRPAATRAAHKHRAQTQRSGAPRRCGVVQCDSGKHRQVMQLTFTPLHSALVKKIHLFQCRNSWTLLRGITNPSADDITCFVYITTQILLLLFCFFQSFSSPKVIGWHLTQLDMNVLGGAENQRDTF